jgi:hypothetical protein
MIGCNLVDQFIGEKVAESGFIALSCLDASGAFGRGIYCMSSPSIDSSFDLSLVFVLYLLYFCY